MEAWKDATRILSVADVNRVIDQLGDALIKIREGREERLMLEMALLWIVRPETSIHPAALLARIEALEARFGEGTRPEGHARPSAPPAASTPGAASTPNGCSHGGTRKSFRRERHPTRGHLRTRCCLKPSARCRSRRCRTPHPGEADRHVGGDHGGLRPDARRPACVPPAWVAFEGGRLVVDCGNHFRLLRLEDSDSATRISDEIKRRTGQTVRIEYVNRATQGVTSPTLQQATTAPTPPPTDAEPPAPRVVQGPAGGRKAASPAPGKMMTMQPRTGLVKPEAKERILTKQRPI